MNRASATLAALACTAALAACSAPQSAAPPGPLASSAAPSGPAASAPPTSPAPTSPAPTSPAPTSEGTVLATADSALGMIVVDGQGLTAYIFTKDTADSGVSACTGQCLAAWPPILSPTQEATVDGVSGDVGTITTPDGKFQVTVNGLPLYTFAQDKKAGDVLGQGVNNVWFAIDPAGKQITGGY